MLRNFFFVLWMIVSLVANGQNTIYKINDGNVQFFSNAPQELISAGSRQLKGILDISKRTFLFRVSIVTFQGFTNPLQREHFNENYLESTIWPEASYSGKIIEDVDLTKDGEYKVRAKGKLTIHGLDQERIINTSITVKKGKIIVHSNFSVALADYNIKIPRVVNQKLAPDISVTVTGTLLPRS